MGYLLGFIGRLPPIQSDMPAVVIMVRLVKRFEKKLDDS